MFKVFLSPHMGKSYDKSVIYFIKDLAIGSQNFREKRRNKYFEKILSEKSSFLIRTNYFQ